MTKKSVNNKLTFLLGRKQQFERGEFFGEFAEKDRKQMADYFLWIKAPRMTQEGWTKEWKQYYSEVLETPSYEIYRAFRGAYNDANKPRMTALGKEAAKLREDNVLVLDKPTCPEYLAMENGYVVATYLQICSNVDRLNREIESEGITENKDAWD